MMLTYKLETEMELVARHMKILKAVMDNQPVGIIKLSHMLNMPEHKIRYSLRLLEQEGIIEASPGGARVTPKVADALKEIRKMLEIVDQKCGEIKELVDSMTP